MGTVDALRRLVACLGPADNWSRSGAPDDGDSVKSALRAAEEALAAYDAVSTLRMGEALNLRFKRLCAVRLVESDLWDRMAVFAVEQVDARRVAYYRGLGIDPTRPNPDGSDFHLMNVADAKTADLAVGKRVVLTEKVVVRDSGAVVPAGTSGLVVRVRCVGNLCAVSFGDVPGVGRNFEVYVDPKHLVDESRRFRA